VEIGNNEKIEHQIVDNYGDLLDLLISIEGQIQNNVIAVDAEWHGQHPVNAKSYMRTVQFAWAPYKAVGIKLHEPGGAPAPGFSGSPDEVTERGITFRTVSLLTVFFKGGEIELSPGKVIKFKRKRVVGHFFNADLEWLLAYGIDIQDCFCCPLYDYEMKLENKDKRLYKLYRNEGFKPGDSVPAWFRTSFEGGADTGLMAHAIEETASYKLETLAMRYTSSPRYDNHLQKWKLDYCRDNGLKSGHLEGYGECPDSVLLPYGMYDADVTLRLYYKLNVLLDEDYEGNNCREAFWESQIATPAVLEIHRTGILVDRGRIDFLTSRFKAVRDELEVKLRKAIQWPDFNVRSTQHAKEFLYGHELNGRLDKVTGKPIRLRPPAALTLALTPLFDTSKPPKVWTEIVRSKRQKEYSPSTNKQVLSLLSQSCPEAWQANYVNQLRDYRFLDQVLKTILRPPMQDKDTEEDIINDEGNFEYEEGLASMCCDDGKVRTHIYQTKETGRWSSARPNLQNISKQRDPDYKRLLVDEYKYSLRSVLKASPGHVLVEADYVGAELFGMAVMSGDANMIEHATRNQLPEDHPEYYDIHSNVAVFAFKLNCPPTKTGLTAIGKKHIRIVAKSVIFGIAYGRGAKAIAVAAKEQGIDVAVDEAQAVIDAIFNMYPKLQPFFEECQQRSAGSYFDEETGKKVEQRYLCNCYGRFRRFPDSSRDRTMAAEFGRQAMNFPIQSMIASAVSRALAYIHDYKRKQLKKGRNLFNVLLQIHDAVLLEVPYAHVKHVCEYVLPTFMRQAVPIYPSKLDGTSTGNGPYYLGIEAEVMHHWGEALTYDEALALGIPTGHGGAEGCVVNYSKGKK
jgi:DNA polymerase I-like protein with 3'-5' exonuclease and polymerase domains